MMLRALFLVCFLSAVAAPAIAQTTIPLDARSAYLHIDRSDSANWALAIPLASLGLAPGYTISLVTAGDWHAGPGGDTQRDLLGVFSNGALLLSGSHSHRVPGAIAAGNPTFTGGTWPNNEPTDIPEDFHVPGTGVTIVIPPGATHLFATPADIYYRDNSDPDGDLGITITLISTASVAPVSAELRAVVRPNPFHGETTIAFHLGRATNLRLTIHDLSGRVVRTLASGHTAAGSHSVRWDGRDGFGRSAPAGNYFARLHGDGRTDTARLTIDR